MLKFSPKFLFLFVSLIILTNQSTANAETLKCAYKTSTPYGYAGLDESMYYCTVRDNGIFNGTRVSIDSVEGENEHKEGMTNANVEGVYFSIISSMKFFPHNLENIFNNLIFVGIFYCDLQEIRQNDLKVFPKLKCLQIFYDEITTIDKDLFKFNTELKSLILHQNKITHIDPNVFDHLNNLSTLWLHENPCKNALSKVEYSRSEVLKLVERVRNGECVKSDV